jgi:hypothetical protein
LRKAEILVKIGAWDKRGRRVNARRFEQVGALLFTTRAGLGERGGFFIWIRRNSLKSPDSAKEKQGNASLVAWIPLVFLAFSWRGLARQVVSAGSGG